MLFGTTTNGGFDGELGQALYGPGTVYYLTPPASPGGAWTHRVLTGFSPYVSGTDEAYPLAPVVIGAQGVVYGTAYGGLFAEGYWGTVFSLTTP